MTRAPRTTAIIVLVLGTPAAAALERTLTLVVPISGSGSLVAATVFAAGMGIAAARIAPWHPHRRFGPANRVTAVRLLLTALVWGLVAEPRSVTIAAAAIVLGLTATALDGVDGWLARSAGTASAFGARFDMEVDALLIMALSTLAWSQGKAGAWVLLSGLMRYVFVGAGWVTTWMSRPLPPSRRRQTTCVIQVLGLLLTLAPFLHPPASPAIAAIALAVLAWSFGIDCVWLWRHAADPAAAHGDVRTP